MTTCFLTQRFAEFGQNEAIVWHGRSYSFKELFDLSLHWTSVLEQHAFGCGSAVALYGDFSPNAIALLVALIRRRAIVVPVSGRLSESSKQVAHCKSEIRVSCDDNVSINAVPDAFCEEPLYQQLFQQNKPGLVLFSSGTTGPPKAAVHDFSRVLEKFKSHRPPVRTLAFLSFDHIGGINTLFHALCGGGSLVTTPDRVASTVLGVIEDHRVELLPTSPTFLKLMLLSEAYRDFNLSSLKRITYGTEPMPYYILTRLNEALPFVEFKQTYGLSEVGIMGSKSKDSSSLWMKLGGEGFEIRVVDNLLEIKSPSAMLGYLNSPSPFTKDGWFVTGDEIENDGEYIRILGRRSSLFNVGGAKVSPSEVEAVVEMLPEIASCTISGEPNPITGMIVRASVQLRPGFESSPGEIAKIIRRHCRSHLKSHEVPLRITIEQTNDKR